MPLECCIVTLNLIFMSNSLILLFIGLVMEKSLDGNYNLFAESVGAVASFTITMGAVLFFAALLALTAYCCQNHMLFFPYIGILVILLIGEVTLGVTFYANKSQLMNQLLDSLRIAQSRYTNDYFANSTWNAIQRDFKCCGVDDYREWFRYLGNVSLPDSCCIDYSVDCGQEAILIGNVYLTNCASLISAWIKRYEMAAAVYLSFMFILQLSSLLGFKYLDVSPM